jgi:electron transport complex protein RnfG
MLSQSISKNAFILGAFAVITTGFVTLTYIVTKPAIAENKKQKLMATLEQVIDDSVYDNILYQNCIALEDSSLNHKKPTKVYRATKQGKPVALLIQSTTPDGYSGDIDILSAVYLDGTVSGVRVLSHKETPGLGDKIEIKRSSWITSFNGQRTQSSNDPNWAVKKDGGEFDAFTGATITPRAVINAVKQTSLYTQENHLAMFSAKNICGGLDE